MSLLRPHEVEVVKLLARGQLPADVLEDVIANASLVESWETGCGYFLTVQHPALRSERRTCSEPLVGGQAGDLACGFVLYLEDGLLTLECHSWGDDAIPAGFRAREIEVGIIP